MRIFNSKMKYYLCLIVLIALGVASVKAIAGRSACRDPVELGQTYPHQWDPTKYWFCEKPNENALEMDCPKGEAYMHHLKTCIPWPNWIWKKPEDPPTLA
uniref:Chitin-binding type-2 domain-containing protein n=1 Tax=Glossina palpalis gambiensis TaxID=67801 RepID=A0A1B0BUM2_9MUSC